MESTWIGIALVAGVVVIIVASKWAEQWAAVRRAEVDARVKQDMLERGLSVEDIERLVKQSPGPAPVPVPVLVEPTKSPLPSRSREAAALATAIEGMVNAGKDADDIAALLDLFLSRQSGPQLTLDKAGEAEPAAAPDRAT